MSTVSTPSRERSLAEFGRAQQLMPGGVNSPARAFGAVGGSPIFIDRADGAYLYDIDGNLNSQIVADGNVDTSVPASYTVQYRVADAAGNVGTASRTYIVTELPPTPPQG